MADYTITLTSDQEQCMKYVIPDIQKWLQGAINGKINQCKKTFIRDWQDKLFKDNTVSTMPATESDFIRTVIARNDYKDRNARDAES